MLAQPDADSWNWFPWMQGAHEPTSDVSSADWLDAAYRRHRPLVLRVLAAQGVRSHALEDAAQDVFMVLHRRRLDFEGRSRLRTWLVGIAIQVARGERASRLRRQRITERFPDAFPLAPQPRDLESQLLGQEAAALIAGLLQAMEPARRRVWLAMDWEGRRGAEVAADTGVCRNTVYSRLRLARNELRRRGEALLSSSRG